MWTFAIKSGINKVFNFVEYGTLASLYLEVERGVITLNETKVNLEEFKNKIKELGTKKALKEPYVPIIS